MKTKTAYYHLYLQESLEAREVFAKGFEEALTRLHKNENINGGPAGGKQPSNNNNNNVNTVNNNSSTNILALSMPPTAAISTTISTTNALAMSGGTVTYTNLGKT